MNSNKKTGKRIFWIIKYVIFLFLTLLITLGLGALFLLFYYTYDLPKPEDFTERPFNQSTKIYDGTGQVVLYNIYGEEKREAIAFNKISDNLKKAVLAAEDTRFYQHRGIDLKSLVRAVLVDLKLRAPTQGASTITQQLIRSVYLTNQKSLTRKVREVVLALELEKKYSKDQIFEWYLNQIPFGENAYGAQSASQTYFNKPASELSLAQAATLTALISAPSYYSPYGPNKNLLLQKKDRILNRMRQVDYITDEQLLRAKEEKTDFADASNFIKAPHFVMYVKKYLDEKYGDEFLKTKGLRVYTSLDWPLQEYVEQIVKEAEKTNIQAGAYNTSLAVIDPKTGQILALIGSKDYFQKSHPEGCDEKINGSCLFDPKFDVATLGQRQPGSAFKPFVYATAFKKGYQPETKLWDIKTEFNINCSPDASQTKDFYNLNCYHPQDYDGNYRGLVSLRQSLAQSLNIPSVQLLYLAGLKDSIKTAQDLGISSLTDPNRYGLSLVLGGGEVNLLEMTSAFGVFAADGLRTPPVSILKIEDSEGNILEENQRKARQVLDKQVARKINDVLSDNDSRVPVFSPTSPLYFKNHQVAAKTGTTQNFKDAWTIGYTPFAAVGVWVGNNNGTPVNKKTGVGLAAPIWRKVMEKMLEEYPVERFTKPDLPSNINPVLLGQLPLDEPHSILYYIDKSNPLGPPSQNPGNDPMYFLWEEAVKNWFFIADNLENFDIFNSEG